MTVVKDSLKSGVRVERRHLLDDDIHGNARCALCQVQLFSTVGDHPDEDEYTRVVQEGEKGAFHLLNGG